MSRQADLEHLEGKLEEFNQKRDDGGADGSATMRPGQVREVWLAAEGAGKPWYCP